MRWARHVARMGRGEAGTGFCGRSLSEGVHLEGPGVVGKIILRCIFRKWDLGAMDWIDLAHYRDSWRALVNVAMILRDP